MATKLLKSAKAWCGLAIAATLLSGCTSSMSDENSLLMEENTELRGQLVERTRAMEMTQAEIRERDLRISELQRDLTASRNTPAPVETYQYPTEPVYTQAAPVDPFGGIEGVTSRASAGEITASLASDVLFDAGRSTLKSSAKRSLQAVVSVLNSTYAGKTIRVAGHTDADPIRKSGHKSNYHLGFERAYAVRDFLVKSGVPAKKVYIASHGPDRALGSKKASRRVEVAVVLNES